eukprot:TRINITY_DN25101_c0_g1_i1.p1 TRINITY_DN25101_c0_g1~~TRINITY_DN25101_c0_g1_i1.p1  ORF type:complete len:547 (+),score=104.55 TRINITY_DN25101_c0_g1_i1:216-1643(+)
MEIEECLKFVDEQKIKDTELFRQLAHIPTQRVATGRAWTKNCCYPITTLLRKTGRSLVETMPAQPYMKNLFGFLHALPRELIFEGEIYRAETGARSNWDEKIRVGNVVEYYEPRSFSTDAKVLQQFMQQQGVRTVTVIKNGKGYVLKDLSFYQSENEVLTEGIMRVRITKCEKFDDSHPLVRAKQVEPGLHYMEGVQLEGVELLSGSPIRKMEREEALANGEEKGADRSRIFVNFHIEMKMPGEGAPAERMYWVKATNEFVTAQYILDQELAKGDYEKVVDAAKRIRGEITDLADLAKAREFELLSSLEDNKRNTMELNESKKEFCAQVHGEYRRLEAVLQQWRDGLLEQAQHAYNDRSKELIAQREKLMQAKDKQLQAIKASEQALDQDDQAIILIRTALGDLGASTCTKAEPVPTFMSLQPKQVSLDGLQKSLRAMELKLADDPVRLTGYTEVKMSEDDVRTWRGHQAKHPHL